ncbi:hypothetical protein IWX48DRAFT_589436 [Phyllosticta citricarpa]
MAELPSLSSPRLENVLAVRSRLAGERDGTCCLGDIYCFLGVSTTPTDSEEILFDAKWSASNTTFTTPSFIQRRQRRQLTALSPAVHVLSPRSRSDVPERVGCGGMWSRRCHPFRNEKCLLMIMAAAAPGRGQQRVAAQGKEPHPSMTIVCFGFLSRDLGRTGGEGHPMEKRRDVDCALTSRRVMTRLAEIASMSAELSEGGSLDSPTVQLTANFHPTMTPTNTNTLSPIPSQPQLDRIASEHAARAPASIAYVHRSASPSSHPRSHCSKLAMTRPMVPRFPRRLHLCRHGASSRCHNKQTRSMSCR